eukprot:CAMPEP_0174700600 /NCGR_PEP_ID=MMETSP1094-20130205/5508_1 /TAXON_ID=156173 /ORGANISM="Chrysochromulina brevifilum, Strain UTEX LB 985" /LENGTH=87 /DNA_ID=CAMNT_0015898111 /DNA_START=126 /DNA_END=389 /DNA_ORIENTATION=-
MPVKQVSLAVCGGTGTSCDRFAAPSLLDVSQLDVEELLVCCALAVLQVVGVVVRGQAHLVGNLLDVPILPIIPVLLLVVARVLLHVH